MRSSLRKAAPRQVAFKAFKAKAFRAAAANTDVHGTSHLVVKKTKSRPTHMQISGEFLTSFKAF